VTPRRTSAAQMLADPTMAAELTWLDGLALGFLVALACRSSAGLRRPGSSACRRARGAHRGAGRRFCCSEPRWKCGGGVGAVSGGNPLSLTAHVLDGAVLTKQASALLAEGTPE
jgi:hypothetical protein